MILLLMFHNAWLRRVYSTYINTLIRLTCAVVKRFGDFYVEVLVDMVFPREASVTDFWESARKIGDLSSF
jgi:hypothetical protein